ncbi:MAG: 2-C-methyl-D-erythritol 4-phosphate cytidylyltransferase [Steroidobacteraceae bacterium]
MHYWLVMPAAGAGLRFGGPVPKQYSSLAGRTVIEWSLAPFVADVRCKGIRVVIAEDDTQWDALALVDPSDRMHSVIGGARRCDSVRRGLADLPAAPDDWVLVHDAARPCLHPHELEHLLTAAETSGDGALLAVPLADTLKRADDSGAVVDTVDRRGLWRAQTPQMFRYRQLDEALAACEARGIEPTDEAQAVEQLGLRPELVAGRSTNHKITTSTDIARAATILEATGGDEC